MKRLMLCLTVLLALTGCGYATAQREPLSSSASSSASSAAPSEKSAVPPTAPTRLRLGDIQAPVVPVELTGSALTPPDDPSTLGWWGKRAGAEHGTTLLTGHTVHDGGGTFDDLELTSPGERAHLSGHTFEVSSVKVISKDKLAERAPALFAQTGPSKLVLITCEDYNPATGHYASNVVVTLEPVGSA